MTDLLPLDRVRVLNRPICGTWAGQRGTVIWAGDGRGADRMCDIRFDNPLFPTATFCGSELAVIISGEGQCQDLPEPLTLPAAPECERMLA